MVGTAVAVATDDVVLTDAAGRVAAVLREDTGALVRVR
jgi:hypothetical protein